MGVGRANKSRTSKNCAPYSWLRAKIMFALKLVKPVD